MASIEFVSYSPCSTLRQPLHYDSWIVLISCICVVLGGHRGHARPGASFGALGTCETLSEVRELFATGRFSREVLELGVWRGYTTAVLADLFFNVIAVDFSQDALTRARQHVGKRRNVTRGARSAGKGPAWRL